MRIVSRSLLCFALVSVLGVAACSGKGYHGAALIESVPAGAEVVDLESDAVLGTTPVRGWWRRNESERRLVNVRLQKSGYRDKTTAFWVTLDHRNRQAAEADPQQINVNLEQEDN